MDRFYKSKLTKLDESTKKDFQPSPTVSHFGEIGSLWGAGVAYFCYRWFMILNREEEIFRGWRIRNLSYVALIS